MPPRPPALARIASTSERARVSTRRSAPASLSASARKRDASSSSGGANGARNSGAGLAGVFKAFPFQVRIETAIILFACGRSRAGASRCLGQSATCYKSKIDLLKQQILLDSDYGVT